MTVGGRAEHRLLAEALDHAQHVVPAHPAGTPTAFLGHGAPERGAFLRRDTSSLEVGVEIFLGLVMYWQLVMLSASFVQADPPPFALLVVILDVHSDDHRHACKIVAMTASRARPRHPEFSLTSIDSSSRRASSGVSTAFCLFCYIF